MSNQNQKVNEMFDVKPINEKIKKKQDIIRQAYKMIANSIEVDKDVSPREKALALTKLQESHYYVQHGLTR